MVTRSIFLIGCPNGYNNDVFLHGADQDLSNMSAYFRSPRGGSFYKDEIVTLYDKPFSEVKEALAKSKADYSIVYFAGHGHTNRRTKSRMLSFKDCHTSDISLFTDSRIQFILVDACRDYIPDISGITEYIEPWAQFDGVSLARQKFDECIANAPAGKLIVYGTKSRCSAWEMHDGSGGLFTLSLLEIATSIKMANLYAPVSIDRLLPAVEKHMLQRGHDKQTPSIVYKTEGYNVPFMIYAPQIKKETAKTPSLPVQKRGNTFPWERIAAVSLTVFILSEILCD